MSAVVEIIRRDDHRITMTADGYYNLEKFVVCGCVHCEGHWDFVAGSGTPPHPELLHDIAYGVDWQWSRPATTPTVSAGHTPATQNMADPDITLRGEVL